MKTNVYFIINNSKELIIPKQDQYNVNLRFGFEDFNYVPRIGEKVRFDYATLFDNCKIKHITDIFPLRSKEKPMQYRERLYKFVSSSLNNYYDPVLKGWILEQFIPRLRRPYVDLLNTFTDMQFTFVVTDVQTIIIEEEIRGIIIYIEDIGE